MSNKRGGSGYKYEQFRCLHNGIPECVGLDLQEIISDCWRPYLINVFQIIYDRDVSDVHGIRLKYQLVSDKENNVRLSPDISYLYVIDFGKRKIYCYGVDLTDKRLENVSDEEIVNSDELSGNVRKTLVYEVSFGDCFINAKFKENNSVDILGIGRDMLVCSQPHFRSDLPISDNDEEWLPI